MERKHKGYRIVSWVLLYNMLFSAVSVLLNGWSFSAYVKLFSYQTLSVVIPGMAMVLILRIKIASDVGWIGYSFVMGFTDLRESHWGGGSSVEYGSPLAEKK